MSYRKQYIITEIVIKYHHCVCIPYSTPSNKVQWRIVHLCSGQVYIIGTYQIIININYNTQSVHESLNWSPSSLYSFTFLVKKIPLKINLILQNPHKKNFIIILSIII